MKPTFTVPTGATLVFCCEDEQLARVDERPYREIAEAAKARAATTSRSTIRQMAGLLEQSAVAWF